jgi:hypothetical protein
LRFADVIKKTSELINEPDEILAIQIIEACFFDLCPQPSAWNEIKDRLREEIINLAESLKENESC